MNETLLDQLTDPQIDPNKQYLSELVGEGKKFKDYEALAKGKAQSDLFIKTLESKMDELRADYLRVMEENKAKAKLEDLLDRFQKKSSNPPDAPANTSGSQDKPAFDPKQVESLVSQKFQEYETNSRQRENFNKVKIRLKERFGDNFQSILNSKRDHLGLSEDEVNNMAKTNPNLFYTVFGVNESERTSFQSPPRNSYTSGPKQPDKDRTMSYYQEMKKKDPRLYYDPKINVQMVQDAERLGEAFFDVD